MKIVAVLVLVSWLVLSLLPASQVYTEPPECPPGQKLFVDDNVEALVSIRGVVVSCADASGHTIWTYKPRYFGKTYTAH